MLHNFNNAVSSNKSKNQIYIIVIIKANADKRALVFFLFQKVLKGVKKNDKWAGTEIQDMPRGGR